MALEKKEIKKRRKYSKEKEHIIAHRKTRSGNILYATPNPKTGKWEGLGKDIWGMQGKGNSRGKRLLGVEGKIKWRKERRKLLLKVHERLGKVDWYISVPSGVFPKGSVSQRRPKTKPRRPMPK